MTAAAQLDMFAELDAAADAEREREQRRRFDEAPSIYSAQPIGLHARRSVFDAWVAEHGNFDSTRRSHAFRPDSYEYADLDPTPSCRPAVLSADLGCAHYRQSCSCVSGRVARAACLGCAYEGALRCSGSTAAEDAHDHVWPGWRDLPIVARRPEPGTSKHHVARMQTWVTATRELLPVGWLESGGPIRTRRGVGTRHVPYATGFGGWDMCGEITGSAAFA